MCGLVNVNVSLQSVGMCVLEVILRIYPGLIEARVDYFDVDDDNNTTATTTTTTTTTTNNNNNNNLQFLVLCLRIFMIGSTVVLKKNGNTTGNVHIH